MKSNIKRILKKLGKANFTSIMFAVVSIISTTFAWFAFSNVVDSDMEINVRSWKIDINEGESQITNKLEIDLDEFYPGMETVYKKLTITNGGDIPSMVSYKINELRIFDTTIDLSNIEQNSILSDLAQEYPFSFNFNLDKRYLGVGDDAEFTYSISWPLDSGDDIGDGLWGNRAYEFTVAEQNKKKQNSLYEMRDSISLEVELVVEQYVENEKVYVSDNNYKFGTFKYLNRYTRESCEVGTVDCVKFTVIDKENSIKDSSVSMFSDPNFSFPSSTYVGYPTAYDGMEFLKLISTDTLNTQIVIPGLSNRVLGYTNFNGYYVSILNKIKKENGFIMFSKERFPMLDTDSCYWLGGDIDEYAEYLAVKSLDDETLQVYYETDSSCKLLTVIDYSK